MRPIGCTRLIEVLQMGMLNGKAYKDMSDEEKTYFRQLFLNAGASNAVPADDGKYEYNYRIN